MNHHDTSIILSYALQSCLLLTVGVIAPRLLRLRHPKTLLAYWQILFPVVVLAPLVTVMWQPKKPLHLLSLDGGVVDEVVATTLSPNAAAFTWEVLFAAALLVTALGLSRIVIGLAYLGRCRRTAKLIDPLPDRVSALQRRLGLDVPFASTDRLSVPITFGWARPIVMVPLSFNGLSADEQEGVACHELLHIYRRDWPVALAEEIVRALLWFHPAVWLLLPRIALCREQVVDAGAIDVTGKRRQYLDALWRIVVSSHKPAADIAVPLIGRSNLRARVECLKKEIAMSKARIIASVAVLVVSIVATGAVGATVLAASASIEEGSAIGTPWSSDDEKPDAETKNGKSKTDAKLQTWDHEGECSEITHPEAIEKVNPTYPPEAREAKITGRVILRSIISNEGMVEDLEVVESPDELLTTAAVDAVEQWRFEPARCDGEPVGVYYNITVNFALK